MIADTRTNVQTLFPFDPTVRATRVLIRETDAWQAALDAGLANRLVVTRQTTVDTMGVMMTFYRVGGRPGAVSRDDHGDVWTICHCGDGVHGRACEHAALALNDAGLWPAGMPINRRTDPPAEISDDTPICCCHILPAVGELHRPQEGDPIIRYRCPVNGLVIGSVTYGEYRAARKRKGLDA